MKPYYYVYRVGYDAPRYKHTTLQSAQTEAERLSSKHPGNAFEILKCIGISSVPAPKASTFWMDGESLPDGEVGLPFPEGFPELPPLPEGYSRWVYRGKFPKIPTGAGECCYNSQIRYFNDSGWWKTKSFDGNFHHIEAI